MSFHNWIWRGRPRGGWAPFIPDSGGDGRDLRAAWGGRRAAGWGFRSDVFYFVM